MYRPPPVLRQQNQQQARPLAAAPKPAWAAAAAQPGRPPLPPGLAAAAPPPPAQPPKPAAPAPARRIEASTTGDVAVMVQDLRQLSPPGGAAAPACSAAQQLGNSAAAAKTRAIFTALADQAVLALATDSLLADLLDAVEPLLRYSPASRQWEAPGLAAVLGPLQLSCQERLRRTSLPCDTALAGAAARFFSRALKLAGQAAVSDGLLAALSAFVSDNARLLNGQVLASTLSLLAAARFQPDQPIQWGNRAVERLLRLNAGKAGLQLCHLAEATAALAELRCCDGLSASPLVNLAVSTARTLEEGQVLDLGQLSHLARIMQSVAIIAATTKFQQLQPTLLAATAAWHLLVVRAESLAAQEAASAPPESAGDNASRAPQLGLALSRMWRTSRLLMAAAKGTALPNFQLPDSLGLVSHTAWLQEEQRTSSTGLTSAQRRVLASLSHLKVASNAITVDNEFLDVFSVSVAVRMRVQSSGQERRTAILIRDPLRQLMRNRGALDGPAGHAAVGSEAALECLLKAAGWQVVCLDTQSCMALPVAILAEELGALMLGEPGSLRYAC